MAKPIVFNTLGREDDVDQSFMEAWEQAEVEADERELKWARELIENRGKEPTREQAGKLTGKHARRRAKKRARERAIWDE